MARACSNCDNKCGQNRILPEIKRKLDVAFYRFVTSDSESLLKKYLTKEVYDAIKKKKTKYGSTLLDCIQSGLENLDSNCGIYAPDPDAYTVFADIFDPIIEDYHGGFDRCAQHPPTNWGDIEQFSNLDPTGDFIISTRVRCGRSLNGYPFNPCLKENEYKRIETLLSNCLKELTDDLKGTYYPLENMSPADQQKLINDHFLFKEGDRFLQSANACQFWPKGRGIFHNKNKTFLCWINEEDHLRIISMQERGNLKEVYQRLVKAVKELGKKLSFIRNDRFGYLTFCPTNLGTTIRASVHIKLPKLSADKVKFEETAAKYNLQIRGTSGEHSETTDGIFDISNKRRLGLTEYEAVKHMNDGIMKMIELEKALPSAT
uniref:arginine kinase n=1 Tax=Cissites cephalotes TaxID=404365 RepID=A4F2K7_9CUCU|nr:arginine kinase [Cissites cephalotes]